MFFPASGICKRKDPCFVYFNLLCGSMSSKLYKCYGRSRVNSIGSLTAIAMKLIIAQCLIFALVGQALGAAIENCHMDRLTACGDPLNEFRREMKQSFPTTADQVKALCEKMKKAIDCAEEFQNKCMTPLQLETLGFLAEGSTTVYQDFCKDGSAMQTEYLKHAPCIDESAKSDEARDHYTYVEAALEDLSSKPPADRLTTTCCGYQWLNDRFSKTGIAKCGKEAVDSFYNVVEMAVSSLPNALCSGFEPDGKTCQAVLPPAGSKPSGAIRKSHLAQTFTSLYLQD